MVGFQLTFFRFNSQYLSNDSTPSARNRLRSRPSSIVFFARGNLMPHEAPINSLRRTKSFSYIRTENIPPSEVPLVFQVKKNTIPSALLLSTAYRALCSWSQPPFTCDCLHSFCKLPQSSQRSQRKCGSAWTPSFSLLALRPPRLVLRLLLKRRIPHPCRAPRQVHLPKTPCRHPE
jgi:hypothetical protein